MTDQEEQSLREAKRVEERAAEEIEQSVKEIILLPSFV